MKAVIVSEISRYSNMVRKPVGIIGGPIEKSVIEDYLLRIEMPRVESSFLNGGVVESAFPSWDGEYVVMIKFKFFGSVREHTLAYEVTEFEVWEGFSGIGIAVTENFLEEEDE